MSHNQICGSFTLHTPSNIIKGVKRKTARQSQGRLQYPMLQVMEPAGNTACKPTRKRLVFFRQQHKRKRRKTAETAIGPASGFFQLKL
jgi:hypothetical protein